MAELGRALNRDEMEAKIKYFDQQIAGIREGIILSGMRSDYDPNSESAQKAATALNFYLGQKQMMADFLTRLDSSDVP
jgi:hypothetical protein